MAFYKLRQGKYMRLERYHELFLAQVDVMNEVGVTIPTPLSYKHVAEQHGRGAPIAADHEEAKLMALTIQFIKGTNASHKPYLSHLRSSYLDGWTCIRTQSRRPTTSCSDGEELIIPLLWRAMESHLHKRADATCLL